MIASVDPLGMPRLDREAPLDPAGPSPGRGPVVDDRDREIAEASGTGECDRLGVCALVELGVADQADDARRGPLGAQPERRADREREAVPERSGRDLDAGDEVAVRVMTEGRAVSSELAQPVDREEALGGEHRVVGHRTVALA